MMDLLANAGIVRNKMCTRCGSREAVMTANGKAVCAACGKKMAAKGDCGCGCGGDCGDK